MKPLLYSATVVALAAFSLQSRVSAQTWSATGGGAFNDTANWAGSVVPGNDTSGVTTDNDIATLSGTGSGGTITVDNGRTIRGLNIFGDVGGYTFTGGTLYISRSSSQAAVIQTVNGTIPAGTATQTIDMPLVLTRGIGEPQGFTISSRYTDSNKLLNFTSNATISSAPLLGESANFSITVQGSNTGDNTLGGVISNGSGTIGIVKREAGTWILGAANTYTGVTTVVNGRLFINGNQTAATGAVTVGNAATLGGGGTIGGATTMNGGSLLVVGASTTTSIGSLEFASSLNLGGASTTLEIGGGSPAEYDRIAVTGTLTFGGALTVTDFMGYDISGQTAAYQLFGIGTSQSGNFASVTVDSIALTQNLGIWTAEDAGVSYAFDQSSGLLTVTTGSSGSVFEEWIATNYPDIPVELNGPDDDADNDGATNLVEFAFGGNPASGSDTIKLHVLEADSEGVEKLVLTLSVRAGTLAFSTDDAPVASHDGILYSISGSLDLQSFATKVKPVAPVVPEGMPPAKTGYEYRSFSLEGSEGLPGQGFIRASVIEMTN